MNYRWLKFLCAAIALRFCTFGHPVVHVDESFYFTVARLWSEGALPYVDVWDRKPLGLFLIYLPAASFGMIWGLLFYQGLAAVFAAATSEMVARLADRMDWRSGALSAGLIYLLWLNLLEGQGGQAPVFYNLLVVCAASFMVPRLDDQTHPIRRHGLAALAMLLIGLALQIKYSVVFEGLFLGLWWVWREWAFWQRLREPMIGALLLAGLAVAPTMIVWSVYWHLGHGYAFAYANFLSILQRQGGDVAELLGNLLYVVAMLSPLTGAAVVTFRLPCPNTFHRFRRRYMFGWLTASLFGVLAYGSWFQHYALAALPPLSVFAAGFVDQHARGRKLLVPFLVSSLVVGQAMVVAKLVRLGTIDQYNRIAKVIGTGSGCLYVYSGESIFYAYSLRCRVTRYLFPSHLGRASEQGAIGTDQIQEIRRIFRRSPDLVLVADPYIGERADIRKEVVSHLKSAYRVKAVLPLGSRTIEIFERQPGSVRPILPAR